MNKLHDTFSIVIEQPSREWTRTGSLTLGINRRCYVGWLWSFLLSFHVTAQYLTAINVVEIHSREIHSDYSLWTVKLYDVRREVSQHWTIISKRAVYSTAQGPTFWN